MAGAGSVLGQLAVGLAGGMDTVGDQSAVMMNMAAKLQGASKQKSTVDSLPDKVW